MSASDGYLERAIDALPTGTPPPAPDTRPRCDDVMRGTAGGINCELAVGHDGSHEWNNEHGGYRWPNRDQPAPTPSGDDTPTVGAARRALLEGRVAGYEWEAGANPADVDALIHAVRAESAARITELEHEIERLRVAADALIAVDARSYRHDPAGEAQRARDLDVAFTNLRAAASRPVPAARVEITDTYGMRETFTDGSRPATPSTDEEGRA